jgi:hypothetical protein
MCVHALPIILSFLKKLLWHAVLCAVLCAVQAIKEISENPSNEVMSRWMEHPQIGPLVQVMWKTMQEQRMQRQ